MKKKLGKGRYSWLPQFKLKLRQQITRDLVLEMYLKELSAQIFEVIVVTDYKFGLPLARTVKSTYLKASSWLLVSLLIWSLITI